MNPKKIRKEIAIRTKELIAQGVNANKALDDARQEANTKYGKDWRESMTSTFIVYPNTPGKRKRKRKQDYKDYSDIWNEKNLDGSFAYNGVTDDF